ncbi:hypothetical protein Ahy_B06g081981 isoform A [Arachis hypogaea]|uniref:Argonaute linker 2 domain-containing protein n=1 Tax=Arachis hypogaea TaxID=3818 RepID=A0A444YMJ4_ARAHY|nr:hypothetical protein Ahy_B06g081981 isoform A [Arachis hypogaea]
MKHELPLLSVAQATFSLRGCYFCFFCRCRCVAQSLSVIPCITRDPSAATLVASTPIVTELSLPPLSSHLLPLTHLPSNLNSLSQFSLKKGGRDGDDGTEEVTVLKLVEKSTLSTLQRASLVEKSSQKPPKRMRVLSDALKTSNYGSEPMLQNCGISISTGFTQVDGRVLPSPRVPEEYSTKFDGSSILKRCSSNANFWNSEWERGHGLVRVG